MQVSIPQMILSGDFFQLPPVAKAGGTGYRFAFEAESWSKTFDRHKMQTLTRVFRQQEDGFVRILEGMRKGLIGVEERATLQSCDRPVFYDDGIEPVGLYVLLLRRVRTVDRAG